MEGHRRALATVRARVKYILVVGAAAAVVVAGALTSGPAHAQTSSHASTAAATTGPNLLTGNQATFSGTTGGWVGSNAVLTPGLIGPALQVTASALSWVSAWSALPPSGTPTPATPGTKYTGDANVEVNLPSPSIGDGLVFFNSAGTMLTAVWGQAVIPTSSTWTTLPQVAATAPSSTAYVAFGVISWTALMGQDFLLQSPALRAITAPAVAPSVVGPLHTSGNQIIQANGQPVTLRGVVMPGLEQSGTLAGTGVSKQAVVEAKAWGANFVRVPLGEQFWLSSNCNYVPSYISTVDQVVKWITSLGMVALLDLHTNTVDGCEAGGPHNMADEAQAPTFWSEVASRYGDPTSPEYNPLVAFDLYNEPHNISDAVWLNGGETTDSYGRQTYEAAGMQQLYNAVRGGRVQEPGVPQRHQLGQHTAEQPREGRQHRLRRSLLHLRVGLASGVHEPRPLRPRPGPEQVGLALGHPAHRGHRIRLALPGEWHLRPQRDRVRRFARVGLERLRLGGSAVPDAMGPDALLARRRHGRAVCLGDARLPCVVSGDLTAPIR